MKIIIMAVRESVLRQVVDLPDEEAERLLVRMPTVGYRLELLQLMTDPEVATEHYFHVQARKGE